VTKGFTGIVTAAVIAGVLLEIARRKGVFASFGSVM